MSPVRPSKSEKESPSGFTLTAAIKYGRIGLKVGIVLFIGLMVLRFVINAATDLYKALNPPPPPPPTVGFGYLPNLDFPDEIAKLPTSYELQTPNGKLPYFSDRAKVFFMPKPQQSLLSLDEAKIIAAKLGFESEPEFLGGTTYRWKDSGEINRTVELDIVTTNFEYSTDFLARPELQLSEDLPNSFDSVQTLKSFHRNGSLLPPDVATASGETTYLKIVGGSLKEAVSLSDAQLVKVTLSRTPIDAKYSPINSMGGTAIAGGLIALVNNKPLAIKADRSYFPIDYSLLETYPIRSTTDAWNVLKAGEGYVAAGNETGKAVIRSVDLGYFESDEYQQYYQPVYIFRGDNGFVGIVSAVSPMYLKSSQPSSPSVPSTSPSAAPMSPQSSNDVITL